ncbi:MAG TPA: alpha/beta hydrolase [Acetobacteraceae bacterium]|jgi:microsomal epoxide hydrolase
MRTRRRILLAWLLASAFIGTARAQTPAHVQSRFFVTGDGVRLHYLQAGPPAARTLLFIPGWTMPAWIWMPQIAAFSRRYSVVAFDPRGQGESQAPATGYDHNRRARDIADLLTHLSPAPVAIVGWSLGVLDALAYVHEAGDAHIAGLVLVDNSVGEEPAPVPLPPRPHPGRPLPHDAAMHRFVAGMFRRRQPDAYIDRLTAATLRTPESVARALLDNANAVPRTYWREAIYSTTKPVLYIVRPGFAAQAANLQAHRPDTETAVFTGAGHALFIDDAARFDTMVANFLRQRVWP